MPSSLLIAAATPIFQVYCSLYRLRVLTVLTQVSIIKERCRAIIIEIHQPEIEALIERRMATGAFRSIEDLLLQSLEASPNGSSLPKHNEKPDGDSEKKKEKQNFSDFLLNSPLHGSGLVVERSKDASSCELAQPRTGRQTGRALIDAMQAMPYNDIDIEPARVHMLVRDVAL